MKPKDFDEVVVGLVQKLQEYDPTSKTLTIEEARDLVRRRRMIVFP